MLGRKRRGTGYLISRLPIKSLRAPASHLGNARNGFLDGTRQREDQAHDGLDVVEMRVRQMVRRTVRRVGGERGDARVLRVEKRLLVRRAENLDFCMRVALKTLDENEIGRTHPAQEIGKAGLVRPAAFGHEREAPGRGDENLVRARLAMEVGILARLIDIERMMRVFQRRDGKAALAQK